jgi:hypothetical protein
MADWLASWLDVEGVGFLEGGARVRKSDSVGGERHIARGTSKWNAKV